ncbi:hypothetical protein [Paludibacterium denitrificans]|uniref:hypothetical protein n=1 Tax=Paludibacterium denitrificans TaxID=2675226 RepID=UPI001E41BE14|nr:hypothetical protein [Paludibacterium denitrificans]
MAEQITFPSMVFANGQATLATYKAVSDHYPLRGQVTIELAGNGQQSGALHPAPGTAWVDLRLAQRLKLQIGDTLTVGNAQLRLVSLKSSVNRTAAWMCTTSSRA